MFVVDTNLLVYAADRDFSEQKRMLGLLRQWASANEPWYTTWSIVYEFLRVTTHRSVFPNPLSFSQSWEFIESVRQASSFAILVETPRHPEIIRSLAAEYPRIGGNHMHDLHIAAPMKEHGVTEIRTADTDFHQFKFLRVTNPLDTA